MYSKNLAPYCCHLKPGTYSKNLTQYCYHRESGTYRVRFMNDQITYMDYLWIQINEDVITIGLNEIGVDELDDNFNLEFPTEDSIVVPNEVCGEIVTEQGSINIYAPVDGKVIEVNEAVKDNHSLVKDDCYHDGWLFKIEVDNIEDLRKFEDEIETDDDL